MAAVVSRAAFILPRLLELAAPLLAPGGVVLALKGVHLGPGRTGGGRVRRPAAGPRVRLEQP